MPVAFEDARRRDAHPERASGQLAGRGHARRFRVDDGPRTPMRTGRGSPGPRCHGGCARDAYGACRRVRASNDETGPSIWSTSSYDGGLDKEVPEERIRTCHANSHQSRWPRRPRSPRSPPPRSPWPTRPRPRIRPVRRSRRRRTASRRPNKARRTPIRRSRRPRLPA